jgi:glutamine synthetase
MGPVKVEYVWIGGKDKVNGKPFTIRSKTKIIFIDDGKNIKLDDIPYWNYDGSSTNQALTEKSEIILVPVAMYNDPFRRDNKNNKLVLCELEYPDSTIHETNNRRNAKHIFDQALNEVPWFGIEQEFFISNKEDNSNIELEQGQFYCSVGTGNAIGRNIIEQMVDHALYAGLQISGLNAEVAPKQWEIQVGPCTGIDSGDQLWILRYIMERVSEEYDIFVDLHPKPFPNINGSGCHVNFSTEKMRMDMGINVINEAIEKFSKKHTEHLSVYGESNNLRLTGSHETSSPINFTYGVGSRNTSIRIPNDVAKNEKGYFEDRRPSSNMDPYLVTGLMFKTAIN